MKVKSAYLFQNNMVFVFDHDYKQIPELQGELTEELIEKIKAHSDENTTYYGFSGNPIQWPDRLICENGVWVMKK